MNSELLEHIRPTRDLLFCRALTDKHTGDTTESGLVLPEQTVDRQRHRQWEVVAVGEEVDDPTLLPGARIMTTMLTGIPVNIDGEWYSFVKEANIIGILLLD